MVWTNNPVWEETSGVSQQTFDEMARYHPVQATGYTVPRQLGGLVMTWNMREGNALLFISADAWAYSFARPV